MIYPRQALVEKVMRGTDRGYDSAGFLRDLRRTSVTPHVARRSRHSAIDGRTTRYEDYALAQKHRKRIEQSFGRARPVAAFSQTVYRGGAQVSSRFVPTIAASSFTGLPRLLGA